MHAYDVYDEVVAELGPETGSESTPPLDPKPATEISAGAAAAAASGLGLGAATDTRATAQERIQQDVQLLV